MAEIDKLEGDIFWLEYDTEAAVDDPEDELSNAEEGGIIEFEQAKRLPNFFGTLINDKARYFDTLEEAEIAIKNSQEENQCSTQTKD
jgi:hypothetical protein